MTDLDRMWRDTAVKAALGRAPGGNVQMLNPRPLVRVRAGYGRAIAITSTHVLHEWVKAGTYYVRWDEKRQVHRVTQDEWRGEVFEDEKRAT